MRRSAACHRLVEVDTDRPEPAATIHGAGHRLPTTRAVPTSVALGLRALGVPVRVRGRGAA